SARSAPAHVEPVVLLLLFLLVLVKPPLDGFGEVRVDVRKGEFLIADVRRVNEFEPGDDAINGPADGRQDGPANADGYGDEQIQRRAQAAGHTKGEEKNDGEEDQRDALMRVEVVGVLVAQ